MVAQTHEVTDDNLKDGEYWFPNLHDTRYFFSPSAFGLDQGEGILDILIGCYGKHNTVSQIIFL